jgi:ABC-type phosphate transport system substrate-binding protein
MKWLAFVFAAVLAAAWAAFGSSPSPVGASSPGGPQIAITPSTNLTTQVVTVTWSGYPGRTPVDIIQCKANPQHIFVDWSNPNDQQDCFYVLSTGSAVGVGNTLRDVKTDKNGSGTAQVEVRDAVDLPSLGCDDTHPCTLYVVPDDTQHPLRSDCVCQVPVDPTYLSAPLTFAPVIGVCSGKPTNLFVNGASSAYTVAGPWSNHVCSSPTDPVNLNYIRQDSPQGRDNFLNGLNDVGVSATPFTQDELKGAAGHRSFAYAPMDVDPTVIVYNMWFNGQRYNQLTLTPRLVAWLLANNQFNLVGSDAARFFTDPEFVRLNPGFQWSGSNFLTDRWIDVEVRSERNDDNLLLTDWLAHNAQAEQLLAGKDAAALPCPSTGPVPCTISRQFTNNFPTDSLAGNDGSYWPLTGMHTMELEELYGLVRCGGDQVQGQGGCSQGHSPSATALPGTTVPTALIGIMDLASAKLYNLPIATIVNAAGQAVQPDPANIQAAIATMKTNPDGVTQWPDFTNTNPAIYPLTRVDYAILPTCGIKAATGSAIQTFINYAVTDGQSSGVLPPGYTPLTQAQVGQAQTAASQVSTTGAACPTQTTGPGGSSPFSPGVTAASFDTVSGAAAGSSQGGAGSSATSANSQSGSAGTTAASRAAAAAAAKHRREVALRHAGVNEKQPGLFDSVTRLLLPLLLLAGLLACISGPFLARYGRRLASQRAAKAGAPHE